MVDPGRRFQILTGREAIFGGGSCRSGCFHDRPDSELAVQ